MKLAGFDVNIDVFRRFAGQALPRHVAYPMPTWWEDFDEADASRLLRESRARTDANDLSLYLHVPFCDQLCRYCACTRVPLSRKSPRVDERTDGYVTAILGEIEAYSSVMGGRPRVRQIHWGGGTPTFLSCERLMRVHGAIMRHFEVLEDAEISIELDPRVTTEEMLTTLRKLGFTRVSLGIQDFDAEVQEHVGRVQPLELVSTIVHKCRALGFPSVNFDLIYGLPLQTTATIEHTLERTLTLSPDRIAYYQFAQIPDKVAVQRGLDYTRLPDSETKLEMFLMGLRCFTDAGYEFIGLDHFAKPDELLAKAHREDTLQRNFQGMTTGGGLDLIGIGASSISHLSELAFLQNSRELRDYDTRVTRCGSAVFRGKRFTEDDIIRQSVLAELYCRGSVRPQLISGEYGIDFAEYFAREMGIMHDLEDDGLVTIAPDGRIVATMPLGRVLMRTIAAVFDAYLAPDAYRSGDRQYFSVNA